MKKSLLCASLILLVCLPMAWGKGVYLSQDETTHLTIYNQGVALVTEEMRASLSTSSDILILEGVSPNILPTSVFLQQIQGPSLEIHGQEFSYRPLNYQNMVDMLLGQKVTFVFHDGEKREGLLLTSRPDVLIQFCHHLAVNPKGTIHLTSIPEGMPYIPTMQWVISAQEGEHLFALHYLTRGLSWEADYVGILDDQNTLSLKGWITVKNSSQMDFTNSSVQIVAGDVKVEIFNQIYPEMMLRSTTSSPTMESIGEYYRYRVKDTLDLPSETQRQVLFLESKVMIDEVFLFPTTMNKGNLRYGIRFENTSLRGLGLPLPMGLIRVYLKEDGVPFFIGEDRISHTKVQGDVQLILGGTFDLTGERRIIERRQLNRDSYLEKIEIILSNQRKNETSVIVEANTWNWKITESSHDYEVYDASLVLFQVTIPKGGVEKIYYTRVSQ